MCCYTQSGFPIPTTLSVWGLNMSFEAILTRYFLWSCFIILLFFLKFGHKWQYLHIRNGRHVLCISYCVVCFHIVLNYIFVAADLSELGEHRRTVDETVLPEFPTMYCFIYFRHHPPHRKTVIFVIDFIICRYQLKLTIWMTATLIIECDTLTYISYFVEFTFFVFNCVLPVV